MAETGLKENAAIENNFVSDVSEIRATFPKQGKTEKEQLEDLGLGKLFKPGQRSVGTNETTPASASKVEIPTSGSK